MSLLGRLAVGWHPERAATIALAHILHVKDSPGMASAFVDMVGRAGPLEFEFLPLDEEEAADTAIARRLLDYRDLVGEISQRLQTEGVARNVNYSGSSYRMRRDQGRDMLVHGKFQRLKVSPTAWESRHNALVVRVRLRRRRGACPPVEVRGCAGGRFG